MLGSISHWNRETEEQEQNRSLEKGGRDGTRSRDREVQSPEGEEEKTKGSGKKWVDLEEKVWLIHYINICIKVELEILSKR